MEATGGWTEWKVQKIEVELPKGYSELKFTSLTKDGMANIDYIGWTSADLHAGKIDIGTVALEKFNLHTSKAASNRYFVDLSGKANGAGAYFMRGNGKMYKVNGRSSK